MDIVGPFTTSHVHGFKWILVVVDDQHSRYKFVNLLKNKSDAYEKVDELLAAMDSMAAARGSPVKVVNIKCDNAGEFLSREFRKMLTEKGIHQTTCPSHVHQLNGVAERAIRAR